MKTITPRTATEALRYARTAERAENLRAEGYTFWNDGDNVAVCKPGRLAASYFISLYDQTCDCPDFAKHGDYCKHTLCFDLIEAENAMCEEFEKMHEAAQYSPYC